VSQPAGAAVNRDDHVVHLESEGGGRSGVVDFAHPLNLEVMVAGSQRAHLPLLALLGFAGNRIRIRGGRHTVSTKPRMSEIEMIVESLMTRSVSSCHPDDSLDAATEQMWHRDCGALPVCESTEPGKVIGMVTDRDICMHGHFQQRPLSELRVEGAMTRNPRTCRTTDSITAAEQIMCNPGVRRLPVVHEDGRLVGIIALVDIAREAARESHLERPEVTESEVGVALAAICSPRLPYLTRRWRNVDGRD
jgi:CBS domain-containing protein